MDDFVCVGCTATWFDLRAEEFLSLEMVLETRVYKLVFRAIVNSVNSFENTCKIAEKYFHENILETNYS